jgi:hypothetical protein
VTVVSKDLLGSVTSPTQIGSHPLLCYWILNFATPAQVPGIIRQCDVTKTPTQHTIRFVN